MIRGAERVFVCGHLCPLQHLSGDFLTGLFVVWLRLYGSAFRLGIERKLGRTTVRPTLSNRDYESERIKSVQYVRNGLWMKRRWLVVVLAVFYFAVVFGGASLKIDYSHISQYISELNASGSAWSWQIGYFGFLPLGLLGFVLLLVVRPGTRLSGTSGIGYWLLIGEPIAYAASAFAPCDPGAPAKVAFRRISTMPLAWLLFS